MRLSQKIFFVISLIFFLNTKSIGQSAQGMWTTDSEFLPQNSIKSIVPDKYGFIWMTTENGLVRYDGESFVTYDSRNSGIKSNRFLYITGNIQSDSLYTVNDTKDQYFFIHKRKIELVDKDKHPNAEQFHRKDASTRFISNGIPSHLFDFPKRPYQIQLKSGKYYHIDSNTIRLFNSNKTLAYKLHFEYDSNSSFFVMEDVLFYMEPNGRYAIMENGKASWKKMDAGQNTKYELYWNSVVQQAFLYHDKKTYLLEYSSGSLKKTVLIENEDMLVNRINTIYFDKKNRTVYIGSTNKGLGTYKIKDFNTLSPNIYEMSEIFYALAPIGKDSVISASGIIISNGRILKNMGFISDNYGMTTDFDKNIWTYKANRLICYTRKSNFKQYREWRFKEDISSLFTDHQGNIWFSISKNRIAPATLYTFKPSGDPVFKKHRSLPFFINTMGQKNAASLLLGSNNGLYELDMDSGKASLYPGTAEIKIRNVYLSKKKDIWFSTYEDGFFLIRDRKVHSFPLGKNNYLLSSHCIVEDRNGFFWIPTNKGLFQVKEKTLLDYADKKITDIYYHYYNKEAGFITNEFNGGCQPCAAISGDHFYLPSINGVVTFNPYRIRPVVPDNDIYIDQAVVDHNKINIQDTLNLSRKFERLTLHITSPYHGNINNQNFEVRLEGTATTDWTKIADDNSISYTTLAPGEYKLVVRKLSGFDSNYIYKSIVIIIEPVFWETLWFKAMFIALIVLIGILFYRIRIRYIKRKNLLLKKKINEQTNDLKNTISMLRTTKENLNQQIENNTKIIQYITHDIKSPLKFMAMVSKSMFNSSKESNPEIKEQIQSIFTSSSQMFNFVDNLLEYSKVYLDKGELYIEEFKPDEVIWEKITFFEGIANAKKITVRNLIKTHTTLRGNKQLFSIIIHNLLDNAIKNTSYGNIIFNAVADKEKTYVSIADTGNGMEQAVMGYYQDLIDNYDPARDKNNKRIGLHIVIELLLILNGKMHIESDANGTTITLSFYNNI